VCFAGAVLLPVRVILTSSSDEKIERGRALGADTGVNYKRESHPIMVKGANIHGIFVGNRAMFEELNAAIEANGIRPVIDKVFPFEAAPDAFRYQKGGAFGKVVIRV
jgi:NADPH:quinone reductase-like Zn-dependent oxidoreductase